MSQVPILEQQGGTCCRSPLLQDFSDFRFQLMQFLLKSREICKTAGLSEQAYVLLLHSSASVDEERTIGRIAEKMDVKPAAVIQLVTRLMSDNLVRLEPGYATNSADRVRLTTAGYEKLEYLVEQHQESLKTLISHFPISDHGLFCTSPVCWKTTSD
jgi:DNA-binding MarR family transcriptional regulator